MMRVPLFVFSDMRGAHRFSNWVSDHFDPLAPARGTYRDTQS